MFYLIKIRKSLGGHTDVYVDFENQLLQVAKWKYKLEANKLIKKIFTNFLLKCYSSNVLPFQIPFFKSKQSYFAILSGIEYAKICHIYSFKAKCKAIYLFDPYPRENLINENAIRSFNINIAFIPVKKAVSYFNSLAIPNFIAYWIPEGVNSQNYKFIDYKDKKIDILQYGRRWDWYHNLIDDFCIRKNIVYKYPTASNKKQFIRRDDLIYALANTKIAICVPRSITHPETHLNLSTVTTRYFECMSSKCLILGTAPDELIELFGYNPIIEIELQNVTAQIEDILLNYTSYIGLIEKNYNNVINNHQWSNRAIEILAKLPG